MSETKEEQERIVRRRMLITGSDAGGIVGASPWAGPLDIWMRKKHPTWLEEPNKKALDRMVWGNRHEPTIANAYSEATGYALHKPPLLVHEKIKWLGGSPDFIIVDQHMGLEVKAVSGWFRTEWGAPDTDEIPIAYFMQCQHYMMLTGFEVWDVAVLIDLADFRIYHLVADVDLQGMLIEAEEEFYNRYIAGNEQPAAEGSKQLTAYLKARYPTHTAKQIQVDPYSDKSLKATLLALRDARTRLAVAKLDVNERRLSVMATMKDAGSLHWEEEELKITWKQARGTTDVDWKAIAQEAMKPLTPEKRKQLVDAHCAAKAGSRRFVVYDKKGNDDIEQD